MDKKQNCTKRKLSWLDAEILIARNKGVGHSSKIKGKRKEVRYYFCDRCRAYHVTKSDWQYSQKDFRDLRSKEDGRKSNSSEEKK